MTDENTQNSNSDQENVSAEREQATVAIANEFLNRATVGEALSQVSLNAILQLAQNKALEQSREQVKEMSDEEVDKLLEELEKAREEAKAEEAEGDE
tara:strand:+ start:1544 stop:1834 length:291 start_codon:yes stop_codon:yes gene_type:complete